jgi:hypothetical protein
MAERSGLDVVSMEIEPNYLSMKAEKMVAS